MKALTVCGFVLMAAVPAAAQQPTEAQTSAIRSACRGDYMNVCGSVPTGGPASLACLQQHAGSVSPGCQQALAALGGTGAPAPGGMAPSSPPAAAPPPMSPREEVQVLRSACRYDYARFCRGIQPGGGRVIACLYANGPSLTPGCHAAVMSLRAPH